MQERYLGDSHDFIKYALLRHLAVATGPRLGVNWYLTEPQNVDRPGNNDGEKRHHLAGGAWQATDLELFERIGHFASPAERTLANVQRFGLLPSQALFHDDLVSGAEREAWHRSAMRKLGSADLVFLDPDNGFEVASAKRRTIPKYALYSEAADYWKAGKAVVAIQFARQCDPVERAQTVRERLALAAGAPVNLPVLRARLAPNILFLTLAPAALGELFAEALTTFAQKCAKVELIN